jgi:hypothetical protein
MQMLQAGRLTGLVLDGERMRWRKALIRHCELSRQLNEEDYPDGD